MRKTALSVVRKFHPEVMRIRDARRNLTLTVTEDDINCGIRKGHHSCGFVQAAKRQLGVAGAVATRSIMYIVKEDTATRYIFPESCRRELISFDRGGFFSPGTYHLKKPWAGNRRINKYPPQPTKEVGKLGKRVAARHITFGIRAYL